VNKKENATVLTFFSVEIIHMLKENLQYEFRGILTGIFIIKSHSENKNGNEVLQHLILRGKEHVQA
jgi:Mn-containing catalase